MESAATGEVLDLAMGFGSALFGHGAGWRALAARVGHDQVPAPGLGDLYTHELRDEAVRALCEWAAANWAGVSSGAELSAAVLHTGSEAVETALKTALRATNRTRIVAFDGAYHGTFGLALAVTHRSAFRAPFAAQYGGQVSFTPFGDVPALDESVACVIVEPVQGRAGVIAPPDGFLEALREECDSVGALLILDDVLIACGRFGSDQLPGASAGPDLVCLGKALGAGLPASAVLARSDVASRAWGDIEGEAIHTSTMLGEPAACVGVLHTLDRLATDDLDTPSAAWERVLRDAALERDLQLRGRGLLWAFDTGRPGAGFELSQRLLRTGVLTVPSGSDGSSLTLYPSTAHGEDERARLLAALAATA